MHIYTGEIKIQNIFSTFVWFLAFLGFTGSAFSQSNLIPRKILALYKSSEGNSEQQNNIYFNAQLPLNNLGLVVTYSDAEGNLPTLDEMNDYRGIISWFGSSEMREAARYRKWLMEMLQSGKYVVILGNLGAHFELGASSTEKDDKEVQRICDYFGLTYNYNQLKNQNVQIDFKNDQFYDYEAKFIEFKPETIENIISVDPQNQVLLSLTADNKKSDIAILTPNGGYIQQGAISKIDTKTYHAQWYIDPFKFFDKAFHCDDLPIADINTTCGYRTAFIHIDGDGFSTISKINRWHNCGKLTKNRILTKFAFPFSFSVIVADVSPAYNGNNDTFEAAREIFRLPNVEPASHGFAHPHDWRTGKLSLKVDSYSYDPALETVGSIKYIQENLVPPGKSVKLFFWTGMCNPNQLEIDLLENQGFLHINGGAGKLDLERPSISTFYPPYGQVGSKMRVNSRISNEFEFTNGWQWPYDGYSNVIKSIQFTGGHRPVAPVNIYFHPYIVEWNEGWQSLRQVLKWAEQQDLTFVYTSDYIKSVKDFINTKIYQADENEYVFLNDGNLRTIRFKNEIREVNLSLSENVIGFTKDKGDLLIHLNARKEHKLVFGEATKTIPYLNYANQLVDSLETQGNEIYLYVRGYGNFHATLKNLSPNAYFSIKKLPLNSQTNSYKQASAFSQQEFIYSTIQYLKSDEHGTLSFESFITNSGKIVLKPSSSINYMLLKSKYWIFLAAVFGFILVQIRLERTNKFNLLTYILSKKKKNGKE